MKPRICLFSDKSVMYKMPCIDDDNYFPWHDRIKSLALKWVKFYKANGYH